MGIQERKEREKEQRRDDIIDAAQKVFFEKGPVVSTMDEIAEVAELSKGTLYLYYKSKEELYLSVLLRGEEIMYEMFARAISTGEPTLKLIRNIGDAYFEFFKKHPNYFRMFQYVENPQYHKQVSEEMRQQCAESDQKVWMLVIGLIQRAIDEGLLENKLDPRQVSVILWSSSTGLMRQMDKDDKYWKEAIGIDLEKTLRLSNSLLLEAMMTEKGKAENRAQNRNG